jgi:hypothetical protein
MSKACCQDKVVYQKTDDHKKINEYYSFNGIVFSYNLPVRTNHNKYYLWTANEDKNYSNYRVRRSAPSAVKL